MHRKDVVNMVLMSLRDVLLEIDDENDVDTDALNESTPLLGKKSILDSLSLVTLIVSIEQRLSEELSIMVTIADERALSQEKSPFRNVATLSDYIMLLIEEQKGHAAT